MARRVRGTKLETRAARLKMPVSKKPVFVKIGMGLGLGYRRNAAAGTWVVRVSDGAGGNSTKAIGAADDFADADGRDVLDFWQAQDRARAIARTIGKAGRSGDGNDSKPSTIASALDRYEADLKIRSGDAGNVARVRMHLPDSLAKKSVALVTARDLRSWRDDLAKALAPGPRTVSEQRSTLPPIMTSGSPAGAHGKPGLPRSTMPRSRAT
jgi:hypothetical protein